VAVAYPQIALTLTPWPEFCQKIPFFPFPNNCEILSTVPSM